MATRPSTHPPQKSGVITIRDVARAASVSVSTVSHVLSGKRPTSSSTRRRVQDAVALLGYRPNAVAQSLVWRRSFALGLVIPDIANPYFPALARGVEDEVRRRGYTLMLGNTDYDTAREAGYLDLLYAHQLAGVIYCPGEEHSPTGDLLRRCARDGLPVVLVQGCVPGVATVGADNRLGGRLAAEHLLALGHRALGIVGARPLDEAVGEREAGFLEALRAAGRPTDRASVPLVFGDHQIEGGRCAMAQLLASHPRVTAVFVLNDLMALGALQAAAAAGRRVPDDLSVVGFDDIPFAELAHPPLTTVAQPVRQLGEQAARLLLHLIEEPAPPASAESSQSPSLVLPTRLVVRASTARVAA